MRFTYFLSRLMEIHFEPLIKKNQAITYIDDTIMQSQNKSEIFLIIHEYHNLLRKAGLKAAPKKTVFFLKKWNFWDKSFQLKEYSQLQSGLGTWWILNHLSPNEASWNFWDVRDFIVATSNISMWIANHSAISLSILLLSIGLKSRKRFFKW